MLQTLSGEKMNYQVGDLFVMNGKETGFIMGIHEPEPEEGWYDKSITIQYSDYWVRTPIMTIEIHLNEPFKPARWYHYPVKK